MQFIAPVQEIQANFSPGISLTVHWDGKLLPALTGKEKVDRIAVLVSGEGVEKLLEVPLIPNGTGESQARAVFNLIKEWNVLERIQFMCFDTTPSNTGPKAGACVLLEKLLKRELLSLACRHHILELIVQSVFDKLFGASSGPNIKLFQRFANSWSSLNKDEYESGMMEETVALQLEPIKDNLVTFINYQISAFQQRDDYKELLHLALLFLGVEPSEGLRIHAPGAVHRARWMAKIIYCLKIYLFRSQFRLTACECTGLREFNVFVIQVYLKAWYTAPSACRAPMNDLQLLKDLVSYRKTNTCIAQAAIKSFSRHLWYLSEKLIGLSFFDSHVNFDTKREMITALEKEGQDNPPKRINLNENIAAKRSLVDFVTRNSRQLFIALEISQEFLKEDPSTWDTNEEYIKGKITVTKLKVVNDAAERGVAMIQSFNTVLTNQEEQKQFLLQLVEKHRQEFPNSKKCTLVEQLRKKQ